MPYDRQQNYLILDTRGCVIHSLMSGEDAESVVLDTEGKRVNSAEYGFQTWMERYFLPSLEMYNPREMIATWDVKGGSEYRNRIFPGYKSRPPMDPATLEQITLAESYVREFLLAMGITQCHCDGLEADDVIAYLVEKLPGEILIYTVDKDLGVLTRPSAMDEHGNLTSCEIWIRGDAPNGPLCGATPNQYISLMKSIVGDTSDTYPGIKGIGEKSWHGIRETLGPAGLDDLQQSIDTENYNHLTEIAGAYSGCAPLQQLIAAQIEWYVQWELAKLHPELAEPCPERNSWHEITWTKHIASYARVHKILSSAGAVDMADKLSEYMPRSWLVTAENTDSLEHFAATASQSPLLALDYESYDNLKHPAFLAKNPNFVDMLSQKITGLSVTYGPNLQYTFYLCIDHADTANLGMDWAQYVWNILIAANRPIVAHNAQFETIVTWLNLQRDIPPLYDTMIMAHHLEERRQDIGRLGLKSLALDLLGYSQRSYHDVVGEGTMRDLTGEQVLGYGADDAVVTASLCDLFMLRLLCEGTWAFVEAHEFPSVPALGRSYVEGEVIDWPLLTSMAKSNDSTRIEATAEMHSLLHQYARDPNWEAAVALLEDLWSYEARRLVFIAEKKGEHIPDDQLEAKRVAMWERVYLASYYVPRVETRAKATFLPTPVKLSKVIAALGLPSEPEFKSVAASRIAGYCRALREYQAQINVDLDQPQGEFLSLLTKSTSEIRDRQGPAYEALEAFCVEVLSRDLPVEVQGSDLKVESDRDMLGLLYSCMGLPVLQRVKVKRGSTRSLLNAEGNPSADKAAVSRHIAELDPADWRVPVLKAIQTIKVANTQDSYFFKPYPIWRHPLSDRVHGQLKLCGTVTRRPSGTSPNKLQVAKGPIRNLYKTPSDDFVCISLDFNGQELRLLGQLSQDPVLLDAYLGEVVKDPHSITSAGIISNLLVRDRLYDRAEPLLEMSSTGPGITYENFMALRYDEDPDHAWLRAIVRTARDKIGKVTNFLTVYGGTHHTLAEKTGLPAAFCKRVIEGLYRTYPRLEPWQDEMVNFAKGHGYVLTAYGNRRHLGAAINGSDVMVAKALERKAINAPVQGSAADILKILLSHLEEAEFWSRYQAHLIAPIYDELAAMVPKNNAIEYCVELDAAMRITPPAPAGHTPIPMVPEIRLGLTSWGDQEELGELDVAVLEKALFNPTQ